METITIARRLAELGQKEEAQKAYMMALSLEELPPLEQFEAASYLFFSKGNPQAAYTVFVRLYNEGYYQDELMNILRQAFYLPNEKSLRNRYEHNCRALRRYPYCFREDFPAFEELPFQFFPFDSKGYLPYYPQKKIFGDYVNFNDTVVDRYFFKDLEHPILAGDVFSQYQLEYLNDNVRKSEWVGRENHVYLHYSNWSVFCAYLQCLDLRHLLEDRKLVFLFEEEKDLYPIDFKERFGIDYSQYPVKPIGVREVNKLIWHTQLATHNGGDFFNEILYGHPNLLALDSIMMDSIEKLVRNGKRTWKKDRAQFAQSPVFPLLRHLKEPSEKDFFVAYFLTQKDRNKYDPTSRIVPALLFQPHFSNIIYEIHPTGDDKRGMLFSKQYEEIRKSPIFLGFKYIKTFTPMRRITTSYAASNRFTYWQALSCIQEGEHQIIPDILGIRLLNRSFMIDIRDKLYRDSVLVRFEDGKLNPKATFTALAEFLDIPYTESMTYCSTLRGINVPAVDSQYAYGGFDPAPIYNTYDDFADDADRALLEYCMQDAYRFYGYDFLYYHGEPVDEAWIEEKSKGSAHLDKFVRETSTMTFTQIFLEELKKQRSELDTPSVREGIEKQAAARAEEQVKEYRKNRVKIIQALRKVVFFINREGQPLRMMKPLQLDPELLEQPLYH